MVLEPSRTLVVGMVRRPVMEAPSWWPFGQVPHVSGGSLVDRLADDAKIRRIKQV
jgi:hypothetical protein